MLLQSKGWLYSPSVLKSKGVVPVNIEIMRAFVILRMILATHIEPARKIDEIEKK